jgi:hypothetical protein
LFAVVEKEINWRILSSQLSVADQDKHRSTISRLDWNEPKYFWITNNVDFIQWKSNKSSQALWLSGPDHRGMKEVSSHIIGATKEKAIQPNSSVLYFFCSTAATTQGSIATVFAHTLLHQIVCSSSDDKAIQIAKAFLKSLLHVQRDFSLFKKNHSLSETVEIILRAPASELRGALVAAIKIAEFQQLSIIIDGIDNTTQDEETFVQFVYFLVRHTTNTNSKFKAFLTSSQNPDLLNTLGRLPGIEYDKERKGLPIRRLWPRS